MSKVYETEGSPAKLLDCSYTFREVEGGKWMCETRELYDNTSEVWSSAPFGSLEDAQQSANDWHDGPPKVAPVHTLGGRVFLCVVGATVEQVEQTYHCSRIKPTIESNIGE